MMHALWMTMTTGESDWASSYADCELSYYEILSSGAISKLFASHEAANDTCSRSEKRQLDMLKVEAMEQLADESTRRRISETWNRLHLRISTGRAEIDGSKLTDREVQTILSASRNERTRRRVWEAYMAIGSQNAPDLMQLVADRNAVAAAQGFSDYFEMKLALQGVSQHELFAIIARLRSGLDATYMRVKAEIDESVASVFHIPVAQLQPWHYEDPFFQRHSFSQRTYKWEPSALLAELKRWIHGRRIGTADFLGYADLWERPGKSLANCCLNIDRGRDVRIMCNLSTDIWGLGKLLHETGHALYEQQIDATLPFVLRQPAHTFLSEGAALLFERLAWEPGWLSDVGIGYWHDHQRMLSAMLKQKLVSLYWTIALVQFERELYRAPGQQLNGLWWDIVENTQLLRRPEEWNLPYWAAKAHLSTLPVYYYNYLYGEIAASQLRYMLDLQFGDWKSEGALVHLRDHLFRPGASMEWQSLLKRCTTCHLDPEFLIHDYC